MLELCSDCGWPSIALGVIAVLVALFFWMNKDLLHYKKLGVPHFTPWPFAGNLASVCFGQTNFGEAITKIYNAFPNNKFVGYYEFNKPNVIIRDLEMIRQITIKDFDHFTDHTPFTNEEMDPLFGKNLFSLQGQKWRAMRATLSPAFTSSKMKAMYLLVAESAQQMARFLLNDLKTGPKVFDMKDLFTRYTNDVIATAAFGLKVDSLSDRENLFYRMAKKSTDFAGILFTIKFLIMSSLPKIAAIFKLSFTPSDVSTFFTNLIGDTIATREREGIIRPDMIHLLMQAKKGTLSEGSSKEDTKKNFPLTDEDIVAQALIFLLAGFDTSSGLMCFTAHELAVNPDIQKRLQDEIDEVRSKEANVSYETLFNMKYMDMVVSEALRKFPPADTTNRLCVKPYVLVDEPNNVKLPLEVGIAVTIPVISIQRDPQYFPNPDKFDPERFSEENKGSINPLTLLSFGIGPRICIGSRFALMEAKLVLFYLLADFNFEVSKKTQVPLQFSKDFTVSAEKGFWIQLNPRKQ